MQIVELGENSMMIMKDSEDPPWVSVGDSYRHAKQYGEQIIVGKDKYTINCLTASEYIYSGGRLILFFKDTIPSRFHLHDKVVLSTRF